MDMWILHPFMYILLYTYGNSRSLPQWDGEKRKSCKLGPEHQQWEQRTWTDRHFSGHQQHLHNLRRIIGVLGIYKLYEFCHYPLSSIHVFIMIWLWPSLLPFPILKLILTKAFLLGVHWANTLSFLASAYLTLLPFCLNVLLSVGFSDSRSSLGITSTKKPSLSPWYWMSYLYHSIK